MSIVTKESNPELYNALFPEDEAKKILEKIKSVSDFDDYVDFKGTEFKPLLDCITNLQEENRIKDTNWVRLKYYLEKLYYRGYIEEPIFDDIDKKIKEIESKVEIKGYQKVIKDLQEENENLREYKQRCEKSLKALHNSKEYKVMKELEFNENMSILIKLDKLLGGDNNDK